MFLSTAEVLLIHKWADLSTRRRIEEACYLGPIHHPVYVDIFFRYLVHYLQSTRSIQEEGSFFGASLTRGGLPFVYMQMIKLPYGDFWEKDEETGHWYLRVLAPEDRHPFVMHTCSFVGLDFGGLPEKSSQGRLLSQFTLLFVSYSELIEGDWRYESLNDMDISETRYYVSHSLFGEDENETPWDLFAYGILTIPTNEEYAATQNIPFRDQWVAINCEPPPPHLCVYIQPQLLYHESRIHGFVVFYQYHEVPIPPHSPSQPLLTDSPIDI